PSRVSKKGNWFVRMKILVISPDQRLDGPASLSRCDIRLMSILVLVPANLFLMTPGSWSIT
ncbi:hypothetical protein L9F63_005373, partial [Diploptera punctata]